MLLQLVPSGKDDLHDRIDEGPAAPARSPIIIAHCCFWRAKRHPWGSRPAVVLVLVQLSTDESGLDDEVLGVDAVAAVDRVVLRAAWSRPPWVSIGVRGAQERLAVLAGASASARVPARSAAAALSSSPDCIASWSKAR